MPLSWLAEYVKLPSSVTELTDRLTMIGHMLDKTLHIEEETVIDLELRGNRADLFGLIGIARDISAAWNVPLTLPPGALLPTIDKKSTLITVEANDIVPRFIAFTASVTVKDSPEWLKKRLKEYGMASINNVVDITNYVMIETGIPIHAFDKHKLSGGHLFVRRAKKNEKMTTFMGETISLTPEDIVLADQKGPQAITLVGSKNSGTTAETKEILIEAAVYSQANVRRTSRRLGVRTEAGTRLEKHLDPNEVPFALARAMFLLQELAEAKTTSKLSDTYSSVRKPITIELPLTEVTRLSGISVTQKEQKVILERLGCLVKLSKNSLNVTVPTFRTDIHESADLVEEVTRIFGYETVPTLTLEGELPPEQTTDRIKQEEIMKHLLVQLQLNEVITSTLVATDNTAIVLTNAPDPANASLRTSLLPNLVIYAKRSLNERAEKVAIFEIGKVYGKRKAEYFEQRNLGMLITGNIDTKSYSRNPRPITYFDLKGIFELFAERLGVHIEYEIQIIGDMYAVEISLDALIGKPVEPFKPYRIAPQYPPIIEDVSFVVNEETKTGELLSTISSFNPLIHEAYLLDAFENKRTFRIVYQDPKKNLSGEEVKPIREKLIHDIVKKYKIELS